MTRVDDEFIAAELLNLDLMRMDGKALCDRVHGRFQVESRASTRDADSAELDAGSRRLSGVHRSASVDPCTISPAARTDDASSFSARCATYESRCMDCRRRLDRISPRHAGVIGRNAAGVQLPSSPGLQNTGIAWVATGRLQAANWRSRPKPGVRLPRLTAGKRP